MCHLGLPISFISYSYILCVSVALNIRRLSDIVFSCYISSFFGLVGVIYAGYLLLRIETRRTF